MSKNERFYQANEEITLRFYQMPKALFGNPKYKGLSLGAKAMYSILRDRQDLSIANNWIDGEGYIYLVFDIDNLAELIEMDRKTVMKYKKELVSYGLLIDKRVGQGKANKLYVLKPELAEDEPQTLGTTKKSKNGTSRSGKNGLQEVEKIHPNDTELSDTELKIDDDDYIKTQKFFIDEFIQESKERNIPQEEIQEVVQELKGTIFSLPTLDDTFDKVMPKYERGEISTFGKYFIQVLKREQRRIEYLDQQSKKVEKPIDFHFYNWLEN
jgi:hypothetical protein